MSTRRRRCAVLTALVALVSGLVSGLTHAQAEGASPLTELVDAAAQRLQVAGPVAAFKSSAHLAIEDPGRVQQELTKLRVAAVAQHIDPAAVPAAPPDLTASRSAIDALNQTMLSQMALNWDLLQSPGCAAQLDDARSNVIRARQLDGFSKNSLNGFSFILSGPIG